MKLTRYAQEAYNTGVTDGTVDDSVADIIEIILCQGVVSYCSANGSYCFDVGDIVMEDSEQ